MKQSDYDTQFTGVADPGKRKHALEQALDIRKFEIGLYWTRATYFWTFIGASLVAYGAARTLSEPQKSDFSVFLSCIGFLFSFAWYCVNRGSKHWQENWENHVDLLENEVTGPLYKIVTSRADPDRLSDRLKSHFTGPYPFSVSKINQIISVYISGLWFFLLWYSLPTFSRTAPVNRSYVIVIGLTGLATAAIISMGRTHGKPHKIVARMRETVLVPDTSSAGSAERSRSRMRVLPRHPLGRLAGWIAVILLGSSVVAWSMRWWGTRQPKPEFWKDLGFETAKFTIQLLLVGVIGSVLVQEYNRGRARKEATNEFRKLVMRTLIRAYSDTKKVRRILRAKCISGRDDEGVLEMPSKSYDEAMEELNDTQIDLEVLLRELGLFNDVFGQAAALTGHLTGMEQYLGNLVDEYEARRRDYGESECRALSTMPAIQAFLGKGDTGDFRKVFGRHFHDAIAVIDEERLRL